MVDENSPPRVDGDEWWTVMGGISYENQPQIDREIERERERERERAKLEKNWELSLFPVLHPKKKKKCAKKV